MSAHEQRPAENTGASSVLPRCALAGGATDAFQQVIEQAVEAGVRKALNISEATNRRLFSIEGGAVYLSLSKREIYNMIATRELPVVPHGRRKMLDVRDLDAWVERAKHQKE